MPGHFDYEILEELSKGKELSQIKQIFSTFISELKEYLKLEPLYQNIIIKLVVEFTEIENASVLDFGVIRVFQNDKLVLNIDEKCSIFLPFILLREAYYCFVDKGVSKLVKICINQIVENDLNRLSTYREWNKLIRDSLVDSDFINFQLDKLQKFFKIKSREPLESSIIFFFNEVREKPLLSHDGSIKTFYDLIFENYSYKTSRSLFNLDIIESLRILIKIFYEMKIYLNLTDYSTLFREFKQKKIIKTDLSLRKFNESLQWINKCSYIAPSYDTFNTAMGLSIIRAVICFHPMLEKKKIKTVMEKWPFLEALLFSENGFEKISLVTFIIPEVYQSSLEHYFNRLMEYGYVIRKKLYRNLKKTSILNLNYFADISNINKIINPNDVNYKSQYEIITKKNYDPIPNPIPLSIFDYIILNRAQYVSVTGLTFDKRIETLNAIKEDVENELRKEISITNNFKYALDKIADSIVLKKQFLRFLQENSKNGFLLLHFQLNHILNYVDLIIKILSEQPEIANVFQLQKLLDNRTIYQNLEDYFLSRDKNVRKIIFRDMLPLYFQSKKSFKKELKKMQSFRDVFNACYNLKIMNLKTVEKLAKNPNLTKEIYQKRKKRYEEIFKPVSSYKITNEKIESTIEAFVKHDPPLIYPFLINTIFTSTFAKYYPELILRDTPETRDKLEEIRLLFPKTYIFKTSNLLLKKKFLHISIYNINFKEKELFLSLLYSFFKDSIVEVRRYFWRGVIRYPQFKSPGVFYDFESKQFFYTEDLFDQLFTYTQKIFGKKLKWSEYKIYYNIQEFLWSKKQDIDTFINTIKKRVSNQDVDFDLRELDGLLNFRKNLEEILKNYDIYQDLKGSQFFKRYISSIKFLPTLQKFGFSQYCLFIRPFNYKEVDFKLLFNNTFQDVKYPACIETNPSLFYRYFFPYRNPNKSYLNWLLKSKKNISEFCLFYKKKIYDILHINQNLTKKGWNYSSIRFKSYVQNVLFNPTYEPKISGVREFDINDISDSNTFGPDTNEFEALTQTYNVNSIDIKSYLGTKYLTTINFIETLLEKKLIFPYLSLKNLDFEEKVLIILPNIRKKINQTIIKIFSFFNFSRIYEIEGEFFIYGFEDVKSFENGLLIEIWFPRCELDEFFEVFDLVFQYFEIKHYLILTDLVDGKHLLKSVYGNLEFLDSYNPLKNLIWNDKDKIWMNHKLFNEKFEPIYPDLLYGENREN